MSCGTIGEYRASMGLKARPRWADIMFADEISLLSQLAASRDNYISDTMQLDLSLGKEVLLECFGGKKPDTHINGLDKVGRLSRMLRWLASSGLPDDFNRLH